MTRVKILLILSLLLSSPCVLPAEQMAVRVEPSDLRGPRPLQKQTATAVIRDYLQSWQSLRAALEQNRADLLDPDFVGTARDKLTDTMREQSKFGIHTRYQDRVHDIRIVFYSPEGLSIQLIDNVEYDEQVFKKDKLLTTQRVHARYVVILTPAEMRWRVRVLQADPF